MKTLKSFEWKVFAAAGPKHDFEKLLDGDIHQLEAGVDFVCKPSTMRTLAANAAKKRGMKVRCNKVEGGLVIQAYKPSDNGQPTEPAAGAVKGKKKK
jgi:hypothetical protein